MKFVRAIWKLLVGIKDALVLIAMLLFFALLYAGLSARPAPIAAGVLTLDIDGSVVEQPTRPGLTDIPATSPTRIVWSPPLCTAWTRHANEARLPSRRGQP